MTQTALRLTKDLKSALVELTGSEPRQADPVVVMAAYLDVLAKEYGLSESLHLDVDPIERSHQIEPIMTTVHHYFGAGPSEFDADLVRARLYEVLTQLADDADVGRALNRNAPMTERRVLHLAQIYWNLEASPDRSRLPIAPTSKADIPVPGFASDFATMKWTLRANQKCANKAAGQSFRTQGARLVVLAAQHLTAVGSPLAAAPSTELAIRPTAIPEEPIQITLKDLTEQAWVAGRYDDAADLAAAHFNIISRQADTSPFDLAMDVADAHMLRGIAGIRPREAGAGYQIVQGSQRDLEKAVTAYTLQHELDPENDEYLEKLDLALLALVQIYSESGLLDQAIASARRAVAIATTRKESSASRKATTLANFLLGDALKTAEQTEEAVGVLASAAAYIEDWLAAEPSEAPEALSLSGVFFSYAQTLQAFGRPHEAVLTAHRAVELSRAHLEDRTDSVDRLAGNLVGLAGVLRDAGRLTEALDATHEATTLRSTLVIKDPDNLVHRGHLATSLTFYSQLLQKAGQATGATDALEDAVTHYDYLLMCDALLPLQRFLYAAALHSLFRAYVNADRLDEATAVSERIRALEDDEN